MLSDLHEACEKLGRDAGAKKVLLCAADGEVLAHAGGTGELDEAAAESVANLAGDLIASGAGGAAERVVRLPRERTACAILIGTRAALVVLFDGATTLDRVRLKMRRARELLLRLVEAPHSNAQS